jgi:broad-specificity NMP kinase
MKKVATNTLATLVLIGIMSLSSVNVSSLTKGAASVDKQQLKRLERVYQHHDRKHELRASVLGISAEELREQLKVKPLDTIVKKHGFKNKLSFYTAVTGKLKDELRRRGWSERKIEEHVQKRLARLSNTLPKQLSFSA